MQTLKLKAESTSSGPLTKLRSSKALQGLQRLVCGCSACGKPSCDRRVGGPGRRAAPSAAAALTGRQRQAHPSGVCPSRCHGPRPFGLCAGSFGEASLGPPKYSKDPKLTALRHLGRPTRRVKDQAQEAPRRGCRGRGLLPHHPFEGPRPHRRGPPSHSGPTQGYLTNQLVGPGPRGPNPRLTNSNKQSARAPGSPTRG